MPDDPILATTKVVPYMKYKIYNYENFYQKLLRPLEKRQTTPMGSLPPG